MAEAGHAPSGVEVRRIVGLAVILAVVVVVIVVFIRQVMVHWVMPEHAAMVTRPAPIPPTPRLEPKPGIDLEALRAQKHALLSQWQWTDSSHTYARIPIDRAMALYAQGVRSSAASPQPQEPTKP